MCLSLSDGSATSKSTVCFCIVCVLCFSHVSICAFVGLCVRAGLFLCSYTSVVINVVYLIGLSPPPVLWAVMKLNPVCISSLREVCQSTSCPRFYSSLLAVLTTHCAVIVHCLSLLPSFSLFLIFFSLVCLFVCVFKLLCISPSHSFFQEPKSERILLWFSTKTQYVSSLPVRPPFWLPPARYANTCTSAPHTETCSQGKIPVVALSLWAVMSCCQFSEKYWTVIAVYPNRLGQCVTKAHLSCSWGFQLFFPIHSLIKYLQPVCIKVIHVGIVHTQQTKSNWLHLTFSRCFFIKSGNIQFFSQNCCHELTKLCWI